MAAGPADMHGVLVESDDTLKASEEQRLASDECLELVADAIADAVKAYREGALFR
jgi:N-acetylmuramoyl-L-alanine amidase